MSHSKSHSSCKEYFLSILRLSIHFVWHRQNRDRLSSPSDSYPAQSQTIEAVADQCFGTPLLEYLGTHNRGDVVLQILGDGELKFPLTIKATSFSTSAREKIEKAGGSIVEVPAKIKWTRQIGKERKAAAAAAAPPKAAAAKKEKKWSHSIDFTLILISCPLYCILHAALCSEYLYCTSRTWMALLRLPWTTKNWGTWYSSMREFAKLVFCGQLALYIYWWRRDECALLSSAGVLIMQNVRIQMSLQCAHREACKFWLWEVLLSSICDESCTGLFSVLRNAQSQLMIQTAVSLVNVHPTH